MTNQVDSETQAWKKEFQEEWKRFFDSNIDIISRAHMDMMTDFALFGSWREPEYYIDQVFTQINYFEHGNGD